MLKFYRFIRVGFFIFLFSSLFFVQNATAREPWAPYKGTSIVAQTGTWQNFTFSYAAAAEFKSPSTYEHETHVYKKFADYAGGNKWRSNLPRKYLDTQAFDCWPFADGDINNLTVGSADALGIFGNKQYYTWL